VLLRRNVREMHRADQEGVRPFYGARFEGSCGKACASFGPAYIPFEAHRVRADTAARSACTHSGCDVIAADFRAVVEHECCCPWRHGQEVGGALREQVHCTSADMNGPGNPRPGTLSFAPRPPCDCGRRWRQGPIRSLDPVDHAFEGVSDRPAKPRHPHRDGWSEEPEAASRAFAAVAFGPAEASATIDQIIAGYVARCVMPAVSRLAVALRASQDDPLVAVRAFGAAIHAQLGEAVTKLLGAQSDADFASRLDHDDKLPTARASRQREFHAVTRVSLSLNILALQ
jgi:hypothetical protein